MDSKTRQETLQLYVQLNTEDLSKENRLERWRNLEPESAEFISILIRGQQSKNVLENLISANLSVFFLQKS